MFIYICIMVPIDATSLLQWHAAHAAHNLQGRHITLEHIKPLLQGLKAPFHYEVLGQSTEGRDIYKVRIGTGERNILIWSQMHGNESTGTKALFDLFNFFANPQDFSELHDKILSNCTVTFIPLLNPDGAQVYTRATPSGIDLNRDVIDKKAPETQLLLDLLNQNQPEYCFNLHDQRTIFSVGDTTKSATLSFLAPSEDVARTVTSGRKATMKVIVAMNELMQTVIPGQVGRYTDEFYPTATGDNFQKMGHNTVLIEAGHFKDDYQREKVRTFNFLALLQGLNFISSNKADSDFNSYFDIPNNTKNFLDIIYKNIFLASENKHLDVGVLFNEKLENNRIVFDPKIEHLGDLSAYNANSVIEETGLKFANHEELQRFLKKRS